MNSLVTLPGGYRVYEYQLVLSPSEDLQQRIFQAKKTMAADYGLPEPSKAKPHITLVRFRQLQMMEERILQRLTHSSMGIAPFKIELRDFGSFPSHTIFIHVPSKVPIQTLVRQLRTDTQKLMKMDKENTPYFIMEPYIAVAQKLRSGQFDQCWLEYEHKHFSGRFMADGMLLLRREEGTFRYQVLKRFEFQDLPVLTKQGALF